MTKLQTFVVASDASKRTTHTGRLIINTPVQKALGRNSGTAATALDRVGELLARREAIAALLHERPSWDGARAFRAATEYSYDLRDEMGHLDKEVETLLLKLTGFPSSRRPTGGN
jgi:hypothetical protein